MTYTESTAAFIADGARHGWTALPFFRQTATALAADLDRRAAAGEAIAPPPEALYAALAATPLPAVRAVILGQDPYPTPGDAHGFAFSVPPGRAVPASLRQVFAAYCNDLALPMPSSGDLRPWAERGVLLLNTALTVGNGTAGNHVRLGWQALAREVIAAVNRAHDGVAFLLWGKAAQGFADGIDTARHVVLSCAHPSPLARAGAPKGSPHPFVAAEPFKAVNAALAARGLPTIDWRLP
ncbi:MAG: uracil-DNA glycosylase [Hyphomicrobiales bacterium]